MAVARPPDVGAVQDNFDVVLLNEDLENSLKEAQKLYDNFKNKK